MIATTCPNVLVPFYKMCVHADIVSEVHTVQMHTKAFSWATKSELCLSDVQRLRPSYN